LKRDVSGAWVRIVAFMAEQGFALEPGWPLILLSATQRRVGKVPKLARALHLASGGQGGGELRSTIQRVGALAGFHLDERRKHLATFRSVPMKPASATIGAPVRP
jgi:hypothetical protein